MIAHSLLTPLISIVQRTNCFYSSNASKEILDHFLPLLNEIEFDSYCCHTALLCAFLPVQINPTLSLHSIQISSMDPFYWIHGLFKLWKSTRNCMEIDYYYISLFSKLSFHQRCNLHFKGFQEEQIRFIFLKASGTLRLPIGKQMELPPLFQRLAGVYGGIISSSSLVSSILISHSCSLLIGS